MHKERKYLVQRILVASVSTYVAIVGLYVLSANVLGFSISMATYVCIGAIAVPTDVMLWTVSLPLREWWMDANKASAETAETLHQIRDSFKRIESDIHVMSLNMNDVRNAVVKEGYLKKENSNG